MDVTTWRKELEHIRLSVDDVIATVPADLDWDREFDAGYGGAEGEPFVAWTEDDVVFCVVYDGAEWLASVPRNPRIHYVPKHHGYPLRPYTPRLSTTSLHTTAGNDRPRERAGRGE